MKKDSKEIVGTSFEEMSISEMVEVQPSKDVELEATPAAISALVSAVGSGVLSAVNC
ncbi:lichenicidin A2 family type 2 lantibiotic [Staphylococcus equorum]